MYDQLNQAQKNAAKEFEDFMLSDEVEMTITGRAGYGKSFLINYLISEGFQKYKDTWTILGQEPAQKEIVITATTNKAASAIKEQLVQSNKDITNVQTIHSYFGLVVRPDFKTGETSLVTTKRTLPKEDVVIIIDEAYMIDRALYHYLHNLTTNCKIIYVGDPYQLEPVNEGKSIIESKSIRQVVLDQPMRFNNQSLIDLGNQLKETVATRVFNPIQEVLGSIEYLDDDGMKAKIIEYFSKPNIDAKIVTYTNRRAIEFNNYIASLRNPNHTTGLIDCESYAANSPIIADDGTKMLLHTDEEVILDGWSGPNYTMFQGNSSNTYPLTVYQCNLYKKDGSQVHVRAALDPKELAEAIKQAAKLKDWHSYFYMKERIADLRSRDASTVHKSQGSTYDAIFIDLEDIGRCHNPNTVARLLYVAGTRAKNKVYLYGSLPSKYGGI